MSYGSARRLTVGMGRPILPESSRGIEAVLKDMIPAKRFAFRADPGITYIAPADWVLRRGRRNYQTEDGEEAAKSHIEQDVEVASRRTSVDAGRLKHAATLAIAGTAYRRIPSGIKIGVYVEDVPDDWYKDGFWIQGERLGVTETFGVSYDPSQHQPPQHVIRLGLVNLPHGASLPSHGEVTEALPDELTVGPLGIVTSE